MKKSLIYSFLIAVGVITFAQIVIKDNDFSENENRNLASMPKFSIETLMSGEFREDFEKYIADQFPLRDLFVGIKSYSEKIVGKKENNGVYIGKDNYFIQKMKDYDERLLDRTVSYINDFSKSYNTYVAVAPTAYTIMSNKLPNFVDKDAELTYINKFYSGLSNEVSKIDLVSVLRNKANEYPYYMTDHHWTTMGAYYAYTQIISHMNKEPLYMNDFDAEKVSDNFLGSLYSKGNFFYAKPDEIFLYRHRDGEDLNVEYVFEGKTTDSLYNLAALETKDKYNVFLDGNFPAIKITNNKVEDGKIAIIKDSYANSMIPFLVNHFNEIYMIDLRQFNGDVREYLNENEIDDVLFLYNANGLSTDNNIYKIKQRVNK